MNYLRSGLYFLKINEDKTEKRLKLLRQIETLFDSN
jgi:hypothetical protein